MKSEGDGVHKGGVKNVASNETTYLCAFKLCKLGVLKFVNRNCNNTLCLIFTIL